jgi:hypothetical protein
MSRNIEYIKLLIAQYDKDIESLKAERKAFKEKYDNTLAQYDKNIENRIAERKVLKEKLDEVVEKSKEDVMVSFKKDCMERAKECSTEDIIEPALKQFEELVAELKQLPFIQISFERTYDDGFIFRYSVKDYSKLTDEIRNKLRRCIRLYGILYC